MHTIRKAMKYHGTICCRLHPQTKAEPDKTFVHAGACGFVRNHLERKGLQAASRIRLRVVRPPERRGLASALNVLAFGNGTIRRGGGEITRLVKRPGIDAKTFGKAALFFKTGL